MSEEACDPISELLYGLLSVCLVRGLLRWVTTRVFYKWDPYMTWHQGTGQER